MTAPGPETLPPDRKAEIRDRNRIVLNRPGTTFRVTGRGTCGRIRVRFGDAQSAEIAGADLAAGVALAHTCTGWGGRKKVTAETVQDCMGSASTIVLVEPAAKALGVGRRLATACNPLPGVPPVRAGSVVVPPP